MEIVILGTGCAKCKKTFEAVQRVIEELGLNANLRKEEDITEIVKYNIMSLPAVVVDGKVRIKGYQPSEKEIKEVLTA